VVERFASFYSTIRADHILNYREFYEDRDFCSGAGIRGRQTTVAGGRRRSVSI
jgi:hypothetical protein